jgi:hypothetical protein
VVALLGLLWHVFCWSLSVAAIFAPDDERVLLCMSGPLCPVLDVGWLAASLPHHLCW